MVAETQTPTQENTPPQRSATGLSFDLAEGMRAELAAIFPTDDAPPAESPSPSRASSPPSEDAPAESAAPEEKAKRTEAKSIPAPKKEEPAAQETPAPEGVTLSKAEYDLLRRQANDQKATAKRLREAEIALKGREGAFAQIAEKYQGTEVENEAYKQWMNAETWKNEQVAAEEKQASDATTAAKNLVKEKEKTALNMWQSYSGSLKHEAGALGLSEADLDAVVEQVKATDLGVQQLGTMYAQARTIEDAEQFAQAGYILLNQGVRAALQQKKLESLKEPEDPEPPPRRTTHFGGQGAVNADPYAHIKNLNERAAQRLRDGMQQELQGFFTQE